MKSAKRGSEFEPCIFCGSFRLCVINFVPVSNDCAVVCRDCKATGPADATSGGAIEKWNDAWNEDEIEVMEDVTAALGGAKKITPIH